MIRLFARSHWAHVVVQYGDTYTYSGDVAFYHTIRYQSGGHWDQWDTNSAPIGNNYSSPSLAIGGKTLYLCAVDPLNGTALVNIKPEGGAWTGFRTTGSKPPTGMASIDCTVSQEAFHADLHAVIVSPEKGGGDWSDAMWHAKRDNFSGNWSIWGNVFGVTGEACEFEWPQYFSYDPHTPYWRQEYRVAADNYQRMHIVTGGDSCNQHAKRMEDGSWSRFGNIMGQAGNLPGEFVGSSSASFDGKGIFVATTDGQVGHVWQTIRNADGTWTPYFEVNARNGGSSLTFANISTGAYTAFTVPIIQ